MIEAHPPTTASGDGGSASPEAVPAASTSSLFSRVSSIPVVTSALSTAQVCIPSAHTISLTSLPSSNESHDSSVENSREYFFCLHVNRKFTRNFTHTLTGCPVVALFIDQGCPSSGPTQP